MKISTACVTGKTHLENNIECQDVVKKYIGENLCITVLSDGAGSKKYGKNCAEVLCETVINYFKDGIGKFNAEKFITKLLFALYNKDLDEKNSGATLLFTVIENNNFLIGHLGDGVIIKSDGDEFKAVSLPENGHLANFTYFLPSSDAQNHFRYTTGKAKDAVFIMASDGISDMLYEPDTNQGCNACKKMAEWLEKYSEAECDEILSDNLKEIFSNYSSDDLSIAIIKT